MRFKLLALALGSAVLLSTFSCQKKGSSGDDTNPGGDTTVPAKPTLLDYKKSKHPIFVGYLVADGNDPYAGYNPANAPDSADFLEFFSGKDTAVSHWRAAQAKGTRIVVCHFVKDAYFDGSAKDPATQVPGYVNPTGFDMNNATATSTYDHWAANTYKKEIDTMGLDGIDIDIEAGTFGGDVPRAYQTGVALMKSVAKYFGPNCTACGVTAGGKKPVFFYDTDGSSGLETQMYTNLASNYDYVVFQSYTTGSHYWKGTDTTNFPSIATTYGLAKTVFLVNGDSFKYPNGTEDVAGQDAKATSDLYKWAAWVKNNSGTGGGVGVYRMSRDYNHTPPFAVSKHSIQIMTPALP